MRLTLYYFFHTFKNQLRKIFRTWVAIFLLVCIVGGMAIGIGVGVVGSLISDRRGGSEEAEQTEENVDDGENTEESISLFSFDTAVPQERRTAAIAELAVGAVVLLVFSLAVLTADKSGSSVFLMADVNLLFPAPMKPQSVLLFRYLMQTAASIAATIYLVFQIPNLTHRIGGTAAVGFSMMGAWVLLLVYSKLFSVLLFTLASSHAALKKRMRVGLFAVLALIAAGFWMYRQQADTDLFAAADGFFNAPVARFVPVWGWLKAMVAGAVTGNAAMTFSALAALVVFAVLLVVLIWHLKADFYEEALAKSSEMAEIQQAAAQSGKIVVAGKRKKDRSERLRRDGLSRGTGASVYFFKAMYNRFRFAHLRYFTKTAEVYLLVGLLAGAFFRFVITADDFNFFPVVTLVFAVIAFYRSLGNPIAADVAQETFVLVPDTARRKVFFSFLGGIVNSALDLVPGFLAAALFLLPDPATVIVWFLLVVSLGAYSDSVGLFIDLSLPTSLTPTVRSMVQLVFIYFGILPDAALIIVGFALGHLVPFAIAAVLFNLAITGLSLLLSPLFLERGRK